MVSASRSVLVVCTEWAPKHGGLPKFNQQFCTALAQSGQQVVCYVPRATDLERQHAAEADVTLITAPSAPGLGEQALLCLPPDLPPGFTPTVIIGHGKHSGPPAIGLGLAAYPDALRVLFVHTAKDIEWYKKAEGSTRAAANQEKMLLDLAAQSDVVVAVGPKLLGDVEIALQALEDAQRPLLRQFNPGLQEVPSRRTIFQNIEVLLIGRMEDSNLKGVDLAARAVATVRQQFNIRATLAIRGVEEGKGDALKERLIAEAGLGPGAIDPRTYTADQREIAADYTRASLMIMPSRTEGFGLVGLEAISYGVPVLLGANSGIAQLLGLDLGADANDYIVQTENDTKAVEDLAIAMRRILSNREAANESARQLRTRLAPIWTWQRSTEQFLTDVRHAMSRRFGEPTIADSYIRARELIANPTNNTVSGVLALISAETDPEVRLVILQDLFEDLIIDWSDLKDILKTIWSLDDKGLRECLTEGVSTYLDNWSKTELDDAVGVAVMNHGLLHGMVDSYVSSVHLEDAYIVGIKGWAEIEVLYPWDSKEGFDASCTFTASLRFDDWNRPSVEIRDMDTSQIDHQIGWGEDDDNEPSEEP